MNRSMPTFAEMLGKSIHITRLTFRAIGQDKEMLVFTALGSIFSLLFVVLMTFSLISHNQAAEFTSFEGAMGVQFIHYFLIYLGTALSATFFNTCVVYTAKTRFNGGDATFMDSLKFAVSRIHVILAWSLIAATVGVLLRMIESAAYRTGPAGAIIGRTFTRIMGAIWGIITIFVVPAMVYDNTGPFKAIRKSFTTVKKTWGDNLLRYVTFGALSSLLLIVGWVMILILTVSMVIGIGDIGNTIGFGLAVLYTICIAVLFSTATVVYNTALYQYATTGDVPRPFTHWEMRNAFMSRPDDAHTPSWENRWHHRR